MSPLPDLLAYRGESTIGWALTQAARLHRTYLNTKLAALGLFAGQEQVLEALSNKGALTIGELAALLRVRPPTASKMVARLAVLRFVQRNPGRMDARTVIGRLTRKGRMAATRLQGLWDEVERDLVKDLDSTGQGQLRRLLLRAAEPSPALENDQRDIGSEWHGGSAIGAPHPTFSGPNVREQSIPRPHG
jgi:DNA-binding MarR family transcriptional regulator